MHLVWGGPQGAFKDEATCHWQQMGVLALALGNLVVGLALAGAGGPVSSPMPCVCGAEPLSLA